MARGRHRSCLRRCLLGLVQGSIFVALLSSLAACEDLETGAGGAASTVTNGLVDLTSTTEAIESTATSADAEASEGDDLVAKSTTTTLLYELRTDVTVSHMPLLAWNRYEEDHPWYGYKPLEGAWNVGVDPLASGGKYKWAATPGSVEMHFEGTAIALYVLKSTECCKIRLSLDRGAAFLIDPYGPRSLSAVWTSPDLPYGQHELFIEWTNVRNAASTGWRLMFDGVAVRGELIPWQYR